MIIHNMEQGTEEWHAIKRGKLSASHAQEIGNGGKGLDTYVLRLMAEFYAKNSESYTNEHMQRGIELEADARAVYAVNNEVRVDQVGFIEHSEFVGCSPDGLVGEDGGIEIKCHDDLAHFKLMLDGESQIESKYIWQIQMNLLITGRQWWDYVAYNPNFENCNKHLLVFRIYPDETKHGRLKAGFDLGEAKIKAIQSKLTL